MTDQERKAKKPLPSSYEAEENASASVDAPASMTVSLPASDAQSAMLSAMNGAMNAIREDISNIAIELKSIKDFISLKNEELRRWQEGYDWAKRKELLGEYANWLDVLSKREQSEHKQDKKEAAKVAKEFRETIEISMENFSLEVIRPEIMDDFDLWKTRAEIIERVETSDTAKNNKIAEVSRCGILYRTGEGDGSIIVVRRAYVNVWRYES